MATPLPPLWKKLVFRLGAIVLGLSPLFAAETLCRTFDWGKPTDFNDPFVGFSDLHPLFVLNEATGRYEIPKSRQTHFRPESFEATKPAGQYRIFVLGGSTVHGHPYATQTSFTSWLELSLGAAAPQRSWRVVNCGGVSYASYRLAAIMQEVLHYEPDMIVFCEGHNEFLEDRSYDHIKHAPAATAWLQQRVAGLRTFTLLRSLVPAGEENVGTGKSLLHPEVDARLDWRGGMEAYHRDDAWRRGVIEHFDFSLRRMAAIAHEADVPLWFMAPVSNLDWAPFKSEHRAGLTQEQRERFDHLLEEGRELYQTDLNEAVERLCAAREIDADYALVRYELAQCYRQLGMPEEARAELVAARDLDICPLRMLSEMYERMRSAAADTSTPLFDADGLFTAHSPDNITGAQWLADHVHPTIEGHQLWAEALIDDMTRRGLINPVADWKTERTRLYEEHLANLPADYFSDGAEVLKGTLTWANGRVSRERKR